MNLAGLMFAWILNLVDLDFLSIYNQPTTILFMPNHNMVITTKFAAATFNKI